MSHINFEKNLSSEMGDQVRLNLMSRSVTKMTYMWFAMITDENKFSSLNLSGH